MRMAALVVGLVLAGCDRSGDVTGSPDTEGPSTDDPATTPTQLGAATDLVGLITADARIDSSSVSAAFSAQSLAFDGISLSGGCFAIPDMDARPSLLPRMTGDRDLGAEVILQGSAGAITLGLRIQYLYLASDVGSELVPDTDYDLVADGATPAFTDGGALRTAAELTVTEPATGAKISRGSPLAVRWTGGGGDFMELLVFSCDQTIHEGFGCYLPDTGGYDVPGSVTSMLDAGVVPCMVMLRHVVTKTSVEGLGTVLGASEYMADVLLSM